MLCANHPILLFTDNEGSVAVFNNQTCKGSKFMHMVKFMVLQCHKHNIVFRAKRIQEKLKDLADSLSRLRVAEFHCLAPNAQKHPTEVPVDLAPDNVDLDNITELAVAALTLFTQASYSKAWTMFTSFCVSYNIPN